jgi:hypothetical protein
VIAQGYVDVKYVHYVLDFYPSVANHTMGYFAELLQDLEKPTTSLSHALYEGFNLISLYEAVSDGKDVCLTSMAETP